VALPEPLHANARTVSNLKSLSTTNAKHLTILFLKRNYKVKSFKAYRRSRGKPPFIFYVSTRYREAVNFSPGCFTPERRANPTE
jgi:hypothetical protein